MPFDGRLVANVGVLAAIVEGGSFAKAAEALGLSPSGVSRALNRLEQRVGVRLLERTTRSVALTDEGRRLYGEIGPLLSGIEDAFTATAGARTRVKGRLRVNVDAFFSRFLLGPEIGRFLTRHPEVNLELVAREGLGDLVGEGFDIALRFGQPPDSTLVSKRLFETHTLTVAAPSYVKRRGMPRAPAELMRHDCILMKNTLTGETLNEWSYRSGRRSESVAVTGRLLVSEVGTLLSACLAEIGVARIKGIGIADLIEKGKLVALLPDWQGEAFPLYALYPSRHLPAAKVRAFIAFVEEVIAARL
jgi:DNA-binding transcriptional LysR family regulator